MLFEVSTIQFDSNKGLAAQVGIREVAFSSSISQFKLGSVFRWLVPFG